MGKEDAARKEVTQATLDEAEKRVNTAEEDEKNHEMVDAAREQMKAAIDGGLHLDPKRISVESAFDEIQREMKEKFSTRLNTKEENEQLAILMQDKRIYETFEIAPEGFSIKFQSVNSDEHAFVSQVCLLNGPALRTGVETVPQYDINMRTELLMSFSVIAINTFPFTPVDIKDLYTETKNEEDGEIIVTSIGDKIRELHKRLGDIRQKLPFGTYSTAITAMGAWTEYQQDLVSPKRIGNFSTPPSAHS